MLHRFPIFRSKLRVISQMEAAECGLACLAMVLEHHGQWRSLPELRERCGSSRNGHTAHELLLAARELGMEGRGVSAPIRALHALRLPAIVHLKRNHFLVLESCRRDGFSIVDPIAGRRRLSHEEAEESFSGAVLELWTAPHFQRRKRISPSLSRYLAALGGQRRALAFVVLANACQQVLAIVAPAASQALIDHVIQPARDAWLLPVLATLGVVAVVQIVLQRLHGVSEATLQASLGMTLDRELGSHLLRLPITFIETRSHGDLLERVNAQAELRQLLADTAQSAFDLVQVALLSILMLTYDPALGGISLALSLLRIAVARWMRRPIAQQTAGELAARGRESGALAEAAAAAEMTRGFGAERQLRDRYAQRVRERIRWSIGSMHLEVGLGRLLSVLDAAMLATIVWYGGEQVILGRMSIGVFAGFLTIRAMVEAPLAAVVSILENWFRARGILERCDDILGVTPALHGDGSLESAPPMLGRIELQDVGFRFGHGPWLLRNVSLTIEPGQHVAIIGQSGQGKSTLLKLMCGLQAPTEGRVLLDGRDVGDYGYRNLARHCGVVLQEPIILEGSVRDALAIRDPYCSSAELVDAAELACFAEVVRRMPEGYDSRLEALGTNLSGGERQRLAIAQALLNRPPVVLLDEGTCSLDRPLERRVLQNIECLGGTIVSVAHRESVVEHASRVVRVQGGTVRDVDPPQRNVTRDRAGRGRAHAGLERPSP